MDSFNSPPAFNPSVSFQNQNLALQNSFYNQQNQQLNTPILNNNNNYNFYNNTNQNLFNQPINSQLSTNQPMLIGSPSSPQRAKFQNVLLPSYLLGDITNQNQEQKNLLTNQDSSFQNLSKYSTNATNSPYDTNFRNLNIDRNRPPPTQSLHDSLVNKNNFLNNSTADYSVNQIDSLVSPIIQDITDNSNNITNNWITVFGFKPDMCSYILQEFSQYGTIIKHIIPLDSNYLYIKYEENNSIKIALNKNGKIHFNNFMIGVLPCYQDPETLNNCNSTQEFPAKIDNKNFLTFNHSNQQINNDNINQIGPQKKTGVLSKAVEFVLGW